MNLTIYFNTYRKVVNTIHEKKKAKNPQIRDKS